MSPIDVIQAPTLQGARAYLALHLTRVHVQMSLVLLLTTFCSFSNTSFALFFADFADLYFISAMLKLPIKPRSVSSPISLRRENQPFDLSRTVVDLFVSMGKSFWKNRLSRRPNIKRFVRKICSSRFHIRRFVRLTPFVLPLV